jgi:hypothetical protein
VCASPAFATSIITCDVNNNIQSLSAARLGLTGPLSDVFRGLTHLQSLDLSGNAFSGPLPSSACLLRQLTYLSLCVGIECSVSSIPLCVWDGDVVFDTLSPKNVFVGALTSTQKGL